MLVLASPIIDLEISRKPKEYHEGHLKMSKEVRDRAGEGEAYGNLASPMTDLEISRKPQSTINDTSKFRKKWEIYRLISPHEVLYINKYIFYKYIL